MPCSHVGQNMILVMAEASISAFEAVIPALKAAGKLNPIAAEAITKYITVAVTTLEEVVADLKTGSSTLPKIAAIIQTVVTAYDNVATLLPPGLSLWVNVANIGIQALLGAIRAEMGTTATTITGTTGITAHAAVAEPIHAGFFEAHKLNGLQKRLKNVEREALIAAS